MSCLFGYCGPQRTACWNGWRPYWRIAVPSGGNAPAVAPQPARRWHRPRIAAWNQETQLARQSDDLLGYGGVLFATEILAGQGNTADQLLAALRQKPAAEASLERLTGAFVLTLSRDDTVYLVRDPAGVKVVYWTVRQNRLLFASEIKALFADPTVPRRMRAGALPEYLTFSFVPDVGTMFEDRGVATRLHLALLRGRVEIRRHFRFEELEADPGRPIAEYPALVRTALEHSVAECLAVSGAKRPAVFLSGGIDSSAVLAVAAQQQPQTAFPTLSAHFGAEYARENDFVQLMVDRYDTEHRWLEIRPASFLEHLREIIWRLDDPIGDPVTMPNYLLARTAAQVADVVLNGEGGDPCFGGPKICRCCWPACTGLCRANRLTAGWNATTCGLFNVVIRISMLCWTPRYAGKRVATPP